MSAPSIADDENWTRIEQLVERLETNRRTAAMAGDRSERPPSDLKGRFVGTKEIAERFQLDGADIDLLMFALAPVVRPRLAWLFREHQSGVGVGFPGIDLICEMLELDSASVITYRNRLIPSAPLLVHGLIERDPHLPYAPLMPTPKALLRILGLQPQGTEIPGARLLNRGCRDADQAAFDPLVCSKHLREQLELIAAWPECDPRLRDWGIRVDHGPVVLFAGASGTGKTMAAVALANRTGRPLYRVDVGMLVSKYIGDTPKNINALFRDAERVDAVLLFDEAEGLFGKRGAVKEARDRYANMEVGHLLSRMEEHPGICLLTTNLGEQIDSAFLRRIDCVLHFNLPDVEQRIELWTRYLGELTRAMTAAGPTSAELKLAIARKLAEVGRLSGAQIANACRYAARSFARDGALPCEQSRLYEGLARGLWAELKKTETSALRTNLGWLKQHLETEPA